jgi:hypothetical protein
MSDPGDLTRVALVLLLWQRYQARDWDGARTLLADDATCVWWTSRERFTGGDSIVHVNAVYPDGWQIVPIEAHPLPDGRVVTLVRVDHGEACFYATSWFTFAGERIAAIEEYWATVEAPPGWRDRGLPGRDVLPGKREPGA